MQAMNYSELYKIVSNAVRRSVHLFYNKSPDSIPDFNI